MNETTNVGSPDSLDAMIDLVTRCLLDLQLPHARDRAILPQTTLIGELGLDSITFAELTASLEDALEVDAFPMQDWMDEQRENDAPITVGTLALACQLQLARQCEKP